MSAEDRPPGDDDRLRLDQPNPARIYDYFLGGNRNFAVDREFATEVEALFPAAGEACRGNRAWTGRVVAAAVEAGIHQFLDLGSGIPGAGDVHEIASRLVADPRVVYVDNEPIALAHARLALENRPGTAIVDADLEDPAAVLGDPRTRALIDFDQPVLVLLAAVLHFVPDERDPARVIAAYRDALVPASMVAVSHATSEQQSQATLRAIRLYERTTAPVTLRGRTELAALLAGFDILEPGVVFLGQWRPTEPSGQPERSATLTIVGSKPAAEQAPPGVDVAVPHSARVWNYWLGGKDNYAADRALGDQVREIMPGVDHAARVSRAFLQRAVRDLVAEAGVRQFLDIGTGLPSADNTHDVAHAVDPAARVVYVDNDPLVLAHARALLTGPAAGSTGYLDADLRDPADILAKAAGLLDFTRPVGLILGGILGHIPDHGQVLDILGVLLGALPVGSYLVWYDGISIATDEVDEAARRYNESGTLPYRLHTREQVGEFFSGLELLEPGIVLCVEWRTEHRPVDPALEMMFCGVARKPDPAG